MSGRFQPGDHLQVKRPRLYFHHGIYVSDDRVIQFGSGVNCESIANMCVSGGWTESYQARKFFLARTVMDDARVVMGG